MKISIVPVCAIVSLFLFLLIPPSTAFTCPLTNYTGTIPTTSPPFGPYGTIFVESSPPGAVIYVNGVNYGHAPATVSSLYPGTYTIVAKLAGFVDFTTSTTISGPTRSSVYCPMIPDNTGNGLYIMSNPPRASIYLDGALKVLITVDGGPGNDTILGSNGPDVLIGGDGDDFIDGQQGNDTVFLGAGNDTFQWDPGDGSDVVEGQAGTDRMVFNGSAIGESFDVSANGSRVRFTRNVATVVMDLDDVETLELNALGGTDALTVNDLAGTDLTSVSADLAGTIGGTTGDAAVDLITVNGTDYLDTISLTVNAGAVEVSGLAAPVRIAHSEAANDSLIVNGLGGVDTITIGAGVTTLIGVTVNQ